MGNWWVANDQLSERGNLTPSEDKIGRSLLPEQTWATQLMHDRWESEKCTFFKSTEAMNFLFKINDKTEHAAVILNSICWTKVLVSKRSLTGLKLPIVSSTNERQLQKHRDMSLEDFSAPLASIFWISCPYLTSPRQVNLHQFYSRAR